MSVSIQFMGATRTVTGSNFLVTVGDTKFVVDCGMYQGPDVEHRNLVPYDYNPEEIDFVLLTHAHIDHSGMLPKLVKHGFEGPIYCTINTSHLTEILLLDSAKIQENNFREAIPWKFAQEVHLAFDTKDAEKTIGMLKAIDFEENFSPAEGVDVRYVRAGHILGAASIEIEAEGKTIVFSGDIGRTHQELIPGFDLDYKKEVDYVVMESLYGGQEHPDRKESVNELITIMRETLDKGGSVFVPCFAVERTQEILHDIKLAKQSGALRENIPVWLDSPMAQRTTRVYEQALVHSDDSMFDFPGLRYVRHYRKSLQISKQKGNIIIAGSGMASGGRIMGHLAANLADKRNTVCFVGYQAEETLGRELTEGAKKVLIDKTKVPVKAKIHHLHGFSAHGDTNDYTNWLKRYASPRLKKTFLIHADLDRAQALEDQFNEMQLDHPYIPEWKEEVDLD